MLIKWLSELPPPNPASLMQQNPGNACVIPFTTHLQTSSLQCVIKPQKEKRRQGLLHFLIEVGAGGRNKLAKQNVATD